MKAVARVPIVFGVICILGSIFFAVMTDPHLPLPLAIGGGFFIIYLFLCLLLCMPLWVFLVLLLVLATVCIGFWRRRRLRGQHGGLDFAGRIQCVSVPVLRVKHVAKASGVALIIAV